MGTLDSEILDACLDDEEVLLRRPGREIGSVPKRAPVSLMRCAEVDGEWRFLDEIESDVFACRRSLETKSGTFTWWRLEIHIESKAKRPGPPVTRGSTVVVTEFPLSTAWVATARLKGANDEGKARVGADWLVDGQDDVCARVDALEVDPFLTDKRFLAAGISDPGLGIEAGSPRESRSLGRYVFGLCAEVERAQEQVWGDEELEGVVLAASEGRLGDAMVKGGGRLVPPWKRDPDEIRQVMRLAVRQALAGPAKESQVSAFLGQPVRVLARRIFFDHMSRLRKLAMREAKRPGPSGMERHTAGGSTPAVSADREAMVQAIEERLARSAKDRATAARLLVDQFSHLAL